MQGVIISALSANGRASRADAGGLFPTVPRQLKRLPGSVRKCPPSPFPRRSARVFSRVPLGFGCAISRSSLVVRSLFALCSMPLRGLSGGLEKPAPRHMAGAHIFALIFPGGIRPICSGGLLRRGEGMLPRCVLEPCLRAISSTSPRLRLRPRGAGSSHFALTSLALRSRFDARLAVG